jgi:hypothetical protein
VGVAKFSATLCSKSLLRTYFIGEEGAVWLQQLVEIPIPVHG